MDFLALPPEINSARMYMGPGAAPLMSAAAGWTAIATAMSEAVAGVGSTVMELAAVWMGPSANAMLLAASLYTQWLTSTAITASQTAAQAQAAAVAYETAFAATVPPFVVAENRVRLATLVATNFLGVNTPAIAATEAEYMEMWAQDVAAMIGYQTGAMAATQLTPFQPLKPLTMGVPAPAVSSPTGTVQSVLGASQGFDPTSGWFGLANEYIQSFLSSAPYDLPISVLSLFSNMWVVGQATSSSTSAANAAAGAADAAADAATAMANTPAPVVNVPSVGSVGNVGSVAARLGAASTTGGLSVPQSWTAQTKPTVSAVAVDGEAGTPGFPGMPMAAMSAGKEQQKQNLKYLNRPRMLPTPVN